MEVPIPSLRTARSASVCGAPALAAIRSSITGVSNHRERTTRIVRECESEQMTKDLPAQPTEENALIYITVRKQLKPGTADDYLAASKAYTDATRAEPGNKFYEHYRSVDDPDRILTIEAFDDAAAGDAHVNSEHFQKGVDGDAKQYIAERPDILYIDVADRDGWDKMSEF